MLLDLRKAFELAYCQTILPTLVRKCTRRPLGWIADCLRDRTMGITLQGQNPRVSNYKQYTARECSQSDPFSCSDGKLMPASFPTGCQAADLYCRFTIGGSNHITAQGALSLFSDECERLWLKISTPKSEAMRTGSGADRWLSTGQCLMGPGCPGG